MKILILEDFGDLYFSFEEEIKSEIQGTIVLSATQPAEAQYLLETEKPDFMVVDLSLVPIGLTKKQTDESLCGRLSGYIWLRDNVFKLDGQWKKKTIIYSGYIPLLKKEFHDIDQSIIMIDKEKSIKDVIETIKKMTER